MMIVMRTQVLLYDVRMVHSLSHTQNMILTEKEEEKKKTSHQEFTYTD